MVLVIKLQLLRLILNVFTRRYFSIVLSDFKGLNLQTCHLLRTNYNSLEKDKKLFDVEIKYLVFTYLLSTVKMEEVL